MKQAVERRTVCCSVYCYLQQPRSNKLTLINLLRLMANVFNNWALKAVECAELYLC